MKFRDQLTIKTKTMSEIEAKKLVNKILVSVISGIIILIITNAIFLSQMAYKGDMTNEFQDKEICELKADQKEIKKEIKEQYYALTKSINEIKDKLK